MAWLLVLAGCAGGGVAGPPTPTTAMNPGDLVVLGDFSHVNAIASSFDRVYVAYPGAVGIWRPQQQRWDVPRSPRYPGMLNDVFMATVDPIDQSVWFATTTGWVHYRPDIDRWDSGIIPGRVTGVADDPENGGAGIWFRTASGWVLQPRFGSAAPARPGGPLRLPATINDAFTDMPQLRAQAAHILTGPLMGQGTFTAAAPGNAGTGWYLGTSNRGLLFFDRTQIDPQPMQLGLPGTAVGAIVATAQGIWVVNDRTLRTPSAITWLTTDLGQSTAIPGSAAFGLPFDAARQVLPGDRVLWIGTSNGLVRAAIDDGKITQWDFARGLPDNKVTALAQVKGRLVVGTMRGLVELGPDDKLTRRGRSYDGPVYSLKANGDTLWVGTSIGLYASLAGDDSLRMPEGFRRQGVIPAVIGVGYVADTLVAMTPDHLIWRNPLTGEWTRGPEISQRLGILSAFTATPDGFWVGGTLGAGLVRPATSVLRPLMVGAELPAEVTSIAINGDYLWVGTIAGLVRIRLQTR